MFGYVTINRREMTREEYRRFRGMYCGLCRTLRRRFGPVGRLALSYDMTFMGVVLSALYETEERSGRERCPLDMVIGHPYIAGECFEYAADMNIVLTYFKCLDGIQDENSLAAKLGAKVLRDRFRAVEARYPQKCAAVEEWIRRQNEIERENDQNIDRCVNLTGDMLGELYAWRDDVWAENLRQMGRALGGFVYFMDAYEDLPRDQKRRSFNPLNALCQRDDYEEMCRGALTMLAADASAAFEEMPVIRDQNIIRNVLYSGLWSRYAALSARRTGGEGGK